MTIKKGHSARSLRGRLALHSVVEAGGALEILAITAGSGNGWDFESVVLQESLPLWDGVESYIDHAPEARSVRDLAGVCSNPRWEETHQGIHLTLTPLGPSADLD